MAFELPTNFTVGNETKAVEGIGSLFEYANYATGGWFGTGIVFLIFVLVFAVSALINIGSAFASASFAAFIFAVYFARIEAVSPTLPLIFGVLTIVGFFWAKSEKQRY